MIGVTSIHTHPSESKDLWRDFRFGKSEKRSPARGLLGGVFDSEDAGETGPPMGRGNGPCRSSPTATTEAEADTELDENTLRADDDDGEPGEEDQEDLVNTLRGVHGVGLVAAVAVSPSMGRRLRSTRRRRGRYGHEPAGETHSLGGDHSGVGNAPEIVTALASGRCSVSEIVVALASGVGNVSEMRTLWAALDVTSILLDVDVVVVEKRDFWGKKYEK